MGHEVDFLAVGDESKSGDAIALRFGNLDSNNRDEQVVVVIDGGFKESGENLVKHIKKYYKTDRVDLAILTHPDADHAAGLEVVLKELKVDCLWMHQPWNHTEDIANMFKDGRVTDKSVSEALRKSLENARLLENLANLKGIQILEPFAGLQDESGYITVIGPTEDYYENLLPEFQSTPESEGRYSLLAEAMTAISEFVRKIAETFDYETLDDSGETTAENNSSVILILQIDGKVLFFTGDAGIPALTEAADYLEDEIGIAHSDISFIQVPHHGSKRNVGPSILNRLVGPKLDEDKKIKTAFVSCAKNGTPKHPAKKVTNAFRRRGAPVCPTNGISILHYSGDAPNRVDYSSIVPLPFYDEVEE